MEVSGDGVEMEVEGGRGPGGGRLGWGTFRRF